MATCNDCIHERVCDSLIKNGLPYLDKLSAEKFCLMFKDKSRFIELPCKVGDTVYTTYHGSLSEYKVTEIRINDFLWAELYNPEYSDEYKTISVCLDFSFNEFVFLTSEEAEKALKGRGLL